VTIVAGAVHDPAARSLAGSAVPVVGAATIFLFACGSSSVGALLDVGRPGRWVGLVVLLVVAGRWAAEGGRTAAVDPVVTAVAGFVVALAIVSTVWSVDPRLTFERALTLAVLVLTGLLLAQAVAGDESRAESVLAGLLAGSALVALAGLLVLAVSHHDAVEVATTDLPPRFKGMGQDPNTSSLLFAVATPVALWLAVSGRSRARRVASAAALALLGGSIVASGSHGAVLAAGAGAAATTLFLAARPGVRVAAIGAVAAVVGLGLWVETLPEPGRTNPPVTAPAPPTAKPGYLDAQINTPLEGELGIPLPGESQTRTLTTSSGRAQAWGGAIRQAGQRPVAGYGFGTESTVFVDRWSTFAGSVPESSYIGIALQLGIAGLVAFAALLAALGRLALRRFSPASVGILAAAVVAAAAQSYIYSVGNVATATVWIGAFLLASLEPVHA
jgi:O-antigen ligase